MSAQTQAVMLRAKKIKVIEAKVKKLSDQIKILKKESRQYEEEGIAFLEKAELEGCKDGKMNVSIKEMDVPVLNDFMTFWKFIKKQNAHELISRSVNSSAWREHDKSVPGVGTFTKKALSITKRR